MGSWNQQTGETSGVGGAFKEVERYNPISGIWAEFDPAFKKRRERGLQEYVPPSDVAGTPPPKAPDMTDPRLMQAAMLERKRTGRGLSSTFVTGQGVGGAK